MIRRYNLRNPAGQPMPEDWIHLPDSVVASADYDALTARLAEAVALLQEARPMVQSYRRKHERAFDAASRKLFTELAEKHAETMGKCDRILAAIGAAVQPSVAVPADRLSDFWRGIYPDGITVEKVCDELHDLEFLAGEVPKVYDHVSGGRISKPNTFAFEVIGEHDRCRERDIEEALAEVTADPTKAAP